MQVFTTSEWSPWWQMCIVPGTLISRRRGGLPLLRKEKTAFSGEFAKLRMSEGSQCCIMQTGVSLQIAKLKLSEAEFCYVANRILRTEQNYRGQNAHSILNCARVHHLFPLSRRSRRARTLCLLPMLGSSLSISSSRCAQKAVARLPQSREWRASAFRSCVRTGTRRTRARRGCSENEGRKRRRKLRRRTSQLEPAVGSERGQRVGSVSTSTEKRPPPSKERCKKLL